MASCGIVCSIFVIICALSSADDKELFEEHQGYVQKFKCSEPRPAVYSWTEIFPNDSKEVIEKDRTILPIYTVLHRCDSSCGGCPYDEVCTEKFSTDVDLVFRKFTMTGHSGKFTYFTIKQRNHTECACEKLGSNDIKK